MFMLRSRCGDDDIPPPTAHHPPPAGLDEGIQQTPLQCRDPTCNYRALATLRSRGLEKESWSRRLEPCPKVPFLGLFWIWTGSSTHSAATLLTSPLNQPPL